MIDGIYPIADGLWAVARDGRLLPATFTSFEQATGATVALAAGASQREEENEPKAELLLTPQWVFRLGSRDAGLILRALGDRLTDAEMDAARELGDRLTALQANGAHDLNLGRTIAVRHMAEARAADGLEPDPLARKRR